jgi:cell wall-associated NlpC family hydrolase
LLMGLLFLSACATKPPAPDTAEQQEANDILFTALGLVGTPYHYGGSTPDGGFDCSGLIQYVYSQSADISLPRTVAEMSRIDAPDVPADHLQAGDLLIFATESGRRPSHAGIYVGEGRFVHAPRAGGTVRMDYLSDSYWQRCYVDAKRPLVSR